METSAASTAVRPGLGPVELPLRMKVLLVTSSNAAGSWLAEAFAADGAAQIMLDEVIGVTAGLARLRDEVFDAVLISHDPVALDAIDLVAALRASGDDEPLIVLGSQPPQELDALLYEAGADDYCCVAETTVRGLLWKLARAMQRCNLARENRRLVQAERQRLQQEHHEAERLIEQQRGLIADLEELCDASNSRSSGPLPLAEREQSSTGNPKSPERRAVVRGEAIKEEGEAEETIQFRPVDAPDDLSIQLPAELSNHYRELLRAYVIMGVGNLSHEMTTLAELLAASNVSAQRALQLHVQVLEELVVGLGNRSARHVMNRADLLALEVLGHLADGYRQRYHERRHPPRQRMLPGFDHSAAAA
jgi:CheY-like chemotaxis protein